MRKYFLLACCSTLILSACNSDDKKGSSETSAPAFDLQKAKADIETQTKKWQEGIQKGDSAAVAAMYTSDAMVFPPGSDIVKANGISALWGSFIRMGVKDTKFTVVDVTGDADFLSESGYVEIYGPNNALLEKDKYAVVWKMENGSWKLFRDIWNPTEPAAAPSK